MKLFGTTGSRCHEIAHMWFGNTVTMEWWTHLWLNEGFVRCAADALFPPWPIGREPCDWMCFSLKKV